MPAAPLPAPEIAPRGPERKRFTRQEVECLTAAGVLAGQRLELIDGDLIDKMGQNPPHALAIRLLLKWLTSFLEGDMILVQLPVQASGDDSERSLPEPDLAVLKERIDLQRRHPRGDEMALVIEVSDTTAAFDRGRKAAIYAKAGVPEYWVLDLSSRILAAHRETDGVQYRQIRLYSEDESVAPLGRSERVKVADVLPRA